MVGWRITCFKPTREGGVIVLVVIIVIILVVIFITDSASLRCGLQDPCMQCLKYVRIRASIVQVHACRLQTDP